MHLEDVKQAEQLGYYALWTATGLRYGCNDPSRTSQLIQARSGEGLKKLQTASSSSNW
jgi:hypothetical protein